MKECNHNPTKSEAAIASKKISPGRLIKIAQM